MKKLNLFAGLGVAVREFPTSTGSIDYALFVEGTPVGIIEANKDEIIALRIIYSQNYKDRPMVINKLQSLYERLKAPGITIDRLWDCYAIKKPDKVRGKSTIHQLADLIAIIRFEMGCGDNL